MQHLQKTRGGGCRLWLTSIDLGLLTKSALVDRAVADAAFALPEGAVDLRAALHRAVLEPDVATLERILADDCSYVHPSGKVETKAELLAGFKAQDRKYKSIKRDDVVVRIYGSTAIVTGRNTISAEYQGKNYDVQNRFTRVYVKKGGSWRSVAFQQTLVSNP